jgi:anthranilate phosphoribosyltransferase
MLALNTAVALMLLEDGLTFPAAVKRAKEAVESGVAGGKFFGEGRAYALYA